MPLYEKMTEFWRRSAIFLVCDFFLLRLPSLTSPFHAIIDYSMAQLCSQANNPIGLVETGTTNAD